MVRLAVGWWRCQESIPVFGLSVASVLGTVPVESFADLGFIASTMIATVHVVIVIIPGVWLSLTISHDCIT